MSRQPSSSRTPSSRTPSTDRTPATRRPSSSLDALYPSRTPRAPRTPSSTIETPGSRDRNGSRDRSSGSIIGRRPVDLGNGNRTPSNRIIRTPGGQSPGAGGGSSDRGFETPGFRTPSNGNSGFITRPPNGNDDDDNPGDGGDNGGGSGGGDQGPPGGGQNPPDDEGWGDEDYDHRYEDDWENGYDDGDHHYHDDHHHHYDHYYYHHYYPLHYYYPWYLCGWWGGISYGSIFCYDHYYPWAWYYSYGRDRVIYVHDPYYDGDVRLSYEDIDEATSYPPMPSDVFLDPDASAADLIAYGRDLFQEQNYLAAAEAFRQAILKDLTDPVPRFAYAQVLFALGNYPHASLAIRYGMKMLPDWPLIGGDVRDLYTDQAEFEKHVEALDHYLENRPADPSGLLVKGYVEYFTADLNGAAATFTALLDVDPQDQAATAFNEAIGYVTGQQSTDNPSTTVPSTSIDDQDG